MNRYVVLRWNILIGLAAAAVLGTAVVGRLTILLFVGVVIFTFYQQVISTLLYAVLADNTYGSDRTKAAVNYKTFSALAMSLGRLIQFFVCLGESDQNSWSDRVFNVLLL